MKERKLLIIKEGLDQTLFVEPLITRQPSNLHLLTCN